MLLSPKLIPESPSKGFCFFFFFFSVENITSKTFCCCFKIVSQYLALAPLKLTNSGCPQTQRCTQAPLPPQPTTLYPLPSTGIKDLCPYAQLENFVHMTSFDLYSLIVYRVCFSTSGNAVHS